MKINGKERHFISTHTPLAGRDRVVGSGSRFNRISTHTPLAGRDFLRARIAGKK